MAGVAWAALAGWVLAAALLLLAHRRIEQLQRADTARKWDLLALRAELGALRGELRAGEPVRVVAAADPVVGTGVSDPAGSAAPPGRRAGTTEARSTEARTTGPTAWRRSHHRPARRDRRRTY
ncbi:hypothetical protein [Pseudonocardia sp. NPDC046786]|uniref:hypothetical protein n=1 Tax=Pseudonocardia sp. NPDC046786 TaxID=3155471 RepID=UPI0033D83D6A